MKQSNLKIIRVAISLFYLLSISLVFFDYRDILSTNAINSILFFQFVPSFLKFINAASISAIGFLIILILTLLFGRIYCSVFCPLGILQDVIAFVSKKLPRKKKFRYKFKKPHTIIRYSLLVITIVSVLFGNIMLVYLLDPYSNFGRISTNLFKPLVVGLNNIIASGFEKMNLYTIYPVQMPWPKMVGFVFPFLIIGTIIFMSLKNGRLYCNTICPVGTFLGFLSKFSIFKINFDETKCSSCGKCAVECKSLCIDVKQKSIDVSRCVGCFNCISVCPEGAIKFQSKLKKSELPSLSKISSEPTDMNKRNFIAVSAAFIIGSLGMSSVLKANNIPGEKKPTVIKNEKSCYPSPPGSVSLANMNNNCIACHLCVSACPTKVLQPSFLQYGLTGMMQPYMDYNINYCNFECTKCGEICPTGAILPVSKKEKKTLQIGKVTFIKENCVVFTEHTACGSCSEHCPTQAVHMVAYKDNLTIPEINPEICIGCGACEHACPTRPYRAIFVNGNLVHETAQEPNTDKLEKANQEEDFPF